MTIMKRNKNKKRFLSVALALTMTATMTAIVPADVVKAADTTVSNPRVEYNTRDTIEFGHYLQEDTNGDGKVDENDTKQPIKWQILSKDGDDLFLLADKALDCKLYNDEYTAVTWETCILRTWLNDDFLNTAFSEAEQKGITTTNVVNADNPEYTTNGGNNTQDKIFLLSLDEVANTSYGFRSGGDQARICEATAYAKQQGAYTENWSWWWLRSPGSDSDNAAIVYSTGYADAGGNDVYISTRAVRPALHLNLSSLTSSDYKMCESKNVSVKASTYDLVELGSYEGKALQWRVLSKNGNDVFLLADRYVTKKEYNDEYNDEYGVITWEDCTLRTWLNGDFYNTAFSDSEKAAIQETTYENADNPFYHTSGGNDTKDYVTLLSLSDIVNPSYGFPEKYLCNSETRIATGLDSDGTSQNDSWWLRSPGFGSSDAACVISSGYARAGGLNVYNITNAVRPALYLNLTSLSSLKVVGTVVAGEDGIRYYDTDGKKTDGTVPDAPTTGTPAASPSAPATGTPTATPSVGPTGAPVATPSVGPTGAPVATPSVPPTGTPSEGTQNPVPSTAPGQSPTASPNHKSDAEITSSPEDDKDTESDETLRKNIVTDDKKIAMVRITDSEKKEAEYVKPYGKVKSTLVIPKTVTVNKTTYKVTSIANDAFKGNKQLTHITIGDNIRIIGDRAFMSCTKLKRVTMGNNVKKVGTKAFYGDKKLTKLTIQSRKLTRNSVGAKAFAKGNKELVVKVPKNRPKLYRKVLTVKGISKKATIK